MKSEANCSKIRRPATNFTEYEDEKLLSLVEKRKHIVESKRNRTVDREKKAKAWEEITNDFNSDVQTSNRNGKQLKKRLENIRTRSKIDLQLEQEQKKTPDGVPPQTPVLIKMKESISGQVNGIENSLHSDANDSAPKETPFTRATREIEIEDVLNMPSDEALTACESTNEMNIKRIKAVSRSVLLNCEYEEHKIRFKTLKITHQTKLYRQEIAKQKIEQRKELHELQKELIKAQIHLYQANPNRV